MRKKTLLLGLVLTPLFVIGAGCGGGPKDAGILRSLDGAQTFEAKNNVSGQNALASQNVLRIVFNPSNPKEIVVGTQGAGFYFSDNQGDSWANVAFPKGNGNAIAIDPSDEDFLYFALDTKIEKSLDSGKSFREVYVDQTGVVNDLIIDGRDHKKILAVSSSGNFLVSGDQGETWRATAFIEGTPKKILLDPNDSNHIYVTTDKKGVVQSTDGGLKFNNTAYANFQKSLKTSNNSLYKISDLSVNPFDAQHVLLASDFGLVETKDAGKTFELLPTLVIPQSVPLRSVAFHPTIKNAVFLSALNKFYTSTDLAQSWSVVELPTSREVYDIAISPQNPNEMYLAIKGAAKSGAPIDFIKFGK